MRETQYKQEDVEYVESEIVTPAPIRVARPRAVFTREYFEGAIDKVSRPVKGKYADKLPSSEEFIRDKRREVELEDR